MALIGIQSLHLHALQEMVLRSAHALLLDFQGRSLLETSYVSKGHAKSNVAIEAPFAILWAHHSNLEREAKASWWADNRRLNS